MPGSIIGAAVKRVEDPRFITGQGGFLPNLPFDGALHMVPVRSTIPHGRITEIDIDEAAASPGVIGVYTAADFDLNLIEHGMRMLPEVCNRPVLAAGVVRFVGEVVAVVVAETERQATDAADLVWVDYDTLPSVGSLDAALAEDAPLVYPSVGSNVVASRSRGQDDDLFGGADRVVELEIRNQRLAAVPLETNSAVAVPDGDDLRVWMGSQHIHGHRTALARVLGMDRERIHAIVPDMGGGFGAKFEAYPEQILVAALARRLGRPVRWTETRSGNLAAMYHGRDQLHRVQAGVTEDGRIVGLRVTIIQNAGAYPTFGAYLATMTLSMVSGVYAIPKIEGHTMAVATHTTPTHAYRGAGRPEATALIERTLDVVAGELGLDPAEIRRRNLIPQDAFPYTTATGAGYDSGDYGRALDLVMERAGYAALREDQRLRRAGAARVQLGIGLSAYVEITAPFDKREWCRVEVHDDGTATVAVGTSSHGQGHATAYAQIIGELLRIPYTDVKVVQGDTDLVPRGGGTGGSRSLQVGGTAVLAGGEKLIEKAKRVVGRRLEAAPADLVVFEGGRVGVAGVPDTGLTWAQIAVLAAEPGGVDEDDEPGLEVQVDIELEHATFPFGAHVAVVEVDTETGEVEVLRMITVDDCGTILNKRLVRGQVHGGVAQGIGQALTEAVRYDEDGQLLSANLTSYLIPAASDLPLIEAHNIETPTPHNPLGAKGIGEAGTIGSTPAIQNAVIDAVAHLGIRHIDMPLTPHRVWTAIDRVD